jgi:2-amino-4-hydroxy-6-hydroxymethyldihydropteridine diphosphokinase
MATALIALGSNLSNPILQIRSALKALAHIPRSQVLLQSSLYRTLPIGYDAESIKNVPDFINAVAQLETTLTPQALLDTLFEIENKAGRERPYQFAPRVLDCDLLLYDDIVLSTEKLTLPHPRMHTRGFVLLPLFEIAPECEIPNHGKIATLIQKNVFNDVQKIPV